MGVIREAQATCVRLADDAMTASEASQKKVEELARQTEAAHKQLEEFSRRTDVALEVIRADIVSIRAEQARLQYPSAATVPAEPLSLTTAGSTASTLAFGGATGS